MTNEDLINIGFTCVPHFTVGNNVIYNLGRERHLSASSVGTPNEMLFIVDQSEQENVIVLWNYDYDGPLTIEKVKQLLKFFDDESGN